MKPGFAGGVLGAPFEVLVVLTVDPLWHRLAHRSTLFWEFMVLHGVFQHCRKQDMGLRMANRTYLLGFDAIWTQYIGDLA